MDSRTKYLLGWSAIVIISLIPVFLWFAFSTIINGLYMHQAAAGLFSGFGSYSTSMNSLAQLFALAGATLFSLNFVLSTRLKFLEDIFGGLDRVYTVHGITGGIAFLLILSHPIFIVLQFFPGYISAAASYFIPGKILAIDFGILAAAGLITLIFLTLFTKIRYHRWKFTHQLMGIVFLIAVLHMLFINQSVGAIPFRGYYVYISIISAVGLSAFFYSIFFRKTKARKYMIKSVRNSKNSIEINFSPKEKPLDYQSGQFVFVRFCNESISKEAHPFSIASGSGKDEIKIIAKKLGDFTEKLGTIKEGETATIEGPYGGFHFKNFGNKDQIWIAAGIGITPFLGMIEDLKENEKIKVDLIYSFRDEPDFDADMKFTEKMGKVKNFRAFLWNSGKSGRIGLEDIKRLSGGINEKEIFICGPDKFKEDLKKSLTKDGVKRSMIHEEIFGLR